MRPGQRPEVQQPAADRAQHVGRRAPEPDAEAVQRHRGGEGAHASTTRGSCVAQVGQQPEDQRRPGRRSCWPATPRRSAPPGRRRRPRGSRASSRRGRPASARRRAAPARRARRPTSPARRSPPRPAPSSPRAWPGSSTSPVSPSRKAPNRARSARVAHSWPAAAITPAWCSGSGRTTSAQGCTAVPSRRGLRRGAASSGVMPERRQHLGGDGVVPRRPAQPGHQLAEQAEPEVGVVEPPGRAEDDVAPRRVAGPPASRRARAPTSRRGSPPTRRRGGRAAGRRCGRRAGCRAGAGRAGRRGAAGPRRAAA